MPEIVFLDHSTATDQQYIENLQREVKRYGCIVWYSNKTITKTFIAEPKKSVGKKLKEIRPMMPF